MKKGGKQGSAFRIVSYLPSSSALMTVKCSSETSVDFQLTTRRYILEDGILHNQRPENLGSNIFIAYYKGGLHKINAQRLRILFHYVSKHLAISSPSQITH
jgi:hypothetical protein